MKRRRARGLCERCYYDPKIRGGYPLLWAKARERVQELPSAIVAGAPDVCRHGSGDGECPQCERIQREQMGAVQGVCREEEAA